LIDLIDYPDEKSSLEAIEKLWQIFDCALAWSMIAIQPTLRE